MHDWSLLAACSLLLLAGCGGTVGPSGGPTADPNGSTATVTPAPTTDTPSTEALPPGLGLDGVRNASRLAAARADALADRRYVERAHTTFRVDGTVLVERHTVSRHGTDAHARTTRYEPTGRDVRDGVLRRGVEWTNATVTVRRIVERDGTVTYTALDRQAVTLTRPQGGYVEALGAGETTVESRRVVNGSARYTLVTTDLPGRGPWAVYTTMPVEARGESRARTVVTEAGVVTRLTVEYPVRFDGRNGTVTHTYRLEAGPVTVDRPDWFGEAVTNG